MESQIKIKLGKDLNKNGICTMDSVLDTKSINKIINIMNNKSFSKILLDSKFKYPVTLKSYIIKLLKLDFQIIKTSLFLRNLSKRLGLKEIADGAFDQESELVATDLYLSKKNENQDYFSWHMDLGIGGKKNATERDFENSKNEKIKFFFYLTPVQINNGSLGYIPFSNHIGKIILDLILTKKIGYKPYNELKDFRNLVADKENYEQIKKEPNGNFVDKFLEDSEFILKNQRTKNYDHEFNDAGGMLAFKELGMHRGAMPTKNDRYVLRFFYRRK